MDDPKITNFYQKPNFLKCKRRIRNEFYMMKIYKISHANLKVIDCDFIHWNHLFRKSKLDQIHLSA